MERRFQNPGDEESRPIDPPAGVFPLLFGVWTEQGQERAVIVAMDANRRIGQTGRVSLFMPLALLEEAADTGFAEHHSSSGEHIFAFRPIEMRRYFDRIFESLSKDELAGFESASTQVSERVARVVREQTDETETVGIRPKVGMYSAFARLNYTPWFALAEFVDNSIQSYLDNEAILKDSGPRIVDIRLDENEIVITDRAAGIQWSEFPRAFSPSQPPVNPTGLSEFGLGMKAAACWFSRKWRVRTSAVGEGTERTIEFDIPRIARDGIDRLPVRTETAQPDSHFTVVTLSDLRVRPRGRTVGKIKDHLASIYRVLIRRHAIDIRFTTPTTSELLSYEVPELLEAPYFHEEGAEPRVWRKEFRFSLDQGQKIFGWAGLLAKGSVSRAGFAVFRRGRLIQGSADETYRPATIFRNPNSYTYQRLIGEIFVDGFDVTHTKDGIQWAGHEEEVLDRIKRELSQPSFPLLQQAEGYRSRVSAKKVASGFGEAAISSAGQLVSSESSRNVLGAQISAPSGATGTADDVRAASSSDIVTRRSFLVTVPGQSSEWRVTFELVRDPSAEWFQVRSQPNLEESEIVILVNLAHPFSERFLNESEETLVPIIRIVAALALSEQTARLSGLAHAGEIRRRMNELLRYSLSQAGES